MEAVLASLQFMVSSIHEFTSLNVGAVLRNLVGDAPLPPVSTAPSPDEYPFKSSSDIAAVAICFERQLRAPPSWKRQSAVDEQHYKSLTFVSFSSFPLSINFFRELAKGQLLNTFSSNLLRSNETNEFNL